MITVSSLPLPKELGGLEASSIESQGRIRLLPFTLVLVGVASFYLVSLLSVSNPVRTKPCLYPRFRREWRTLNQKEKLSYVSAAQGLIKAPSASLKSYLEPCVSAYVHDSG